MKYIIRRRNNPVCLVKNSHVNQEHPIRVLYKISSARRVHIFFNGRIRSYFFTIQVEAMRPTITGPRSSFQSHCQAIIVTKNWNKRGPNFTQTLPKNKPLHFLLIFCVFKKFQKVTNIWATFETKFVPKPFPKIAKSGHTAGNLVGCLVRGSRQAACPLIRRYNKIKLKASGSLSLSRFLFYLSNSFASSSSICSGTLPN